MQWTPNWPCRWVTLIALGSTYYSGVMQVGHTYYAGVVIITLGVSQPLP